MKITLAHGSGGRATSQLIDSIFAKAFDNPVLNQMEDSAVLTGDKKIAMTTDSFVVTPLFFPGGDIGRLSVCGTVNDLLARGAVPKYLSCGFIIEEGAETELLSRIARSMADTAKEAGVLIVAGDTKVVEGSGGVYINTTGIGFVADDTDICAANCKPGDVLLVSGNLGDHHAAILGSRMGIENTIESDCAPLNEMVLSLLENGIEVHALRDITRGGLGTVANELAAASGCKFILEETALPVNPSVVSFAKILGLEPLYMGNEGKLLAVVPREDAVRALAVIRQSRYGGDAAAVGVVEEGKGVILKTRLGGARRVTVLLGEGLPRIC